VGRNGIMAWTVAWDDAVLNFH